MFSKWSAVPLKDRSEMANSFSDLSSARNHDSSNEVFPYDETYFLNLESQSNIYCCSTLFSADEEKLLIATLRGNVSCIECVYDGKGPRNLCANAVYLSYIPGMLNYNLIEYSFWLTILILYL